MRLSGTILVWMARFETDCDPGDENDFGRAARDAYLAGFTLREPIFGLVRSRRVELERRLAVWASTAVWARGRIFGNIVNAPEAGPFQVFDATLQLETSDLIASMMARENVLWRAMGGGR